MNDKYVRYFGKFFVVTKDYSYRGTEWFKGEEFKIISVKEHAGELIIQTRWALSGREARPSAHLYVKDLEHLHEIARRMYKNEGKRFKETAS